MNPIEDWLTQPDGLADRLRTLRTRAGLSGKELAAALKWQPSKVSRLENGKQMATPADLDAWARACEADTNTAQNLLQMLDEVRTVHRDWRRRMQSGQAAVQTSYLEMVRGSSVIRHFETVYIPGPLQTVDYARRVLTEMVDLHGLDVQDIDAAVAARMQRQQHLYDPNKRFEFLVAEPVLRFLLCPPATMRGQLDRLQTVIGMPNIRFGVLPMGTGPLPITPQNSFQTYDDVAIVETILGESTHRDDEAQTYIRVMERLWAESVEGEDARPYITAAARALPGEGPQ